jgi:hypothetical protein
MIDPPGQPEWLAQDGWSPGKGMQNLRGERNQKFLLG